VEPSYWDWGLKFKFCQNKRSRSAYSVKSARSWWDDQLYFMALTVTGVITVVDENPEWGKSFHAAEVYYLQAQVIWAVRARNGPERKMYLARRHQAVCLFRRQTACIDSCPCISKWMAAELKEGPNLGSHGIYHYLIKSLIIIYCSLKVNAEML